MIRALVLVVGLSSLDPSGCGIDGADAGDEGGTSDATTVGQTVGTQCTEIITELCSQGLSRCALSYALSDCVANGMPMCCSSGDSCDSKATSSQSDVDTCKTDIDNADCNYIVNATYPSSCQSLLHP
jgi:hypothetical protein